MIEDRGSLIGVSMLGDDRVMHNAECDVVNQVVRHLLCVCVSTKRRVTPDW